MKKAVVFSLVLTAGAEPLLAADTPAGPPSQVAAPAEPSPEVQLAREVAEIVAAKALSAEEQQKLVAEAVGRAVAAATESVSEPARIVEIAAGLAAAAAKAAPQFARAITAGVAAIPKVAAVAESAVRIQTAVASTMADGASAPATPAAVPAPREATDFGGSRNAVTVSPSR
jgi:hypothetical protein